jgi:hypothetical protein
MSHTKPDRSPEGRTRFMGLWRTGLVLPLARCARSAPLNVPVPSKDPKDYVPRSSGGGGGGGGGVGDGDGAGEESCLAR